MNPADVLTAKISGWQRTSLIVGIAGAVAAVAAYFIDPAQFLRSYLFAYLYWTGLALGCLAILLIHHVVGGKWGMLIRRFCEAGARTLPIMGVLLIPVILGMSTLYIWARPEALHDAAIQRKAAYLNVPFFIGRAIFYFAVWFLYSHLLSKWSAEQDRTGDECLIGRMRSLSAPGLVVFTLTTTFAFIDWIMSLEPHWFSTVYGAMFMVGETLEAFAFVIALMIVLSRMQPLRQYITPQHVHDLGNLMFAFMVLWAYLSFSQFLITWAGNLPEEIPWYVSRLRSGWGWVALVLVVFHFAVPFFLLLMRGVKRHEDRLFPVCLLMLVVRLIDVYWITEPAFYGKQVRIHWMDFITPVAIGGVWLTAFFWQLKTRPLLPLKDPRLQGAPRETVAF
ncbi:MAG: hypothetical protein ABJF23_22505 [Bryobacteraceae bacterium]